MVSSNTRTARTVAAFTALSLLSSCTLLPAVSAKCSHDIAQRGLEQHNRIVAMRESMPLEKRQSPPPIDLSQQRGILGMLFYPSSFSRFGHGSLCVRGLWSSCGHIYRLLTLRSLLGYSHRHSLLDTRQILIQTIYA
jgi:hypothetical protein